MNPSRTKTTDFRPARVTVAILVHLPYQAGYYEHRLSVLKASLWSLKAHTRPPYDLMLFDNGSSPEASGYLRQLHDSGEASFVLRSDRNLGKLGALRMLFGAAPGELVAYADDDFYFYPDWLETQIKVLDTFPHVGMVGGYAVPSFFTPDRTASNQRAAETVEGMEVEPVQPFPEGWIREWAESTGRDPEAAVSEQAHYPSVRYRYQGVEALGAANHDQFLCRRSVILECLPAEWTGELMGQMIELDRAIDRAGYLRLSTSDRTSQHMGNVISPNLAARLPADFGEPAAGQRRSGGLRRRLLRWRPIRWFLLGVYSHLFRWINPE
jgi:glycosyltransferase involved in cell wall biosynthesis